MSITDAQLESALLAGNYVGESELAAAKEKKQAGETLEAYLKRAELVSDDIIGQAVAETYGLPYIDLDSEDISAETLALLDPESAQKYRAIFVSEIENRVVVATDNPKNAELVNQIKTLFPGKELRIGYALSSSIDKHLARY